MNKLSYVDVIKQTVEHFKVNPRSVSSDDTCMYQTDDKKRCGVSIWLNNDVDRKMLDNQKYSGIYGLILDEIVVKSDFKQEVQHLFDKVFWADIQQIHDNNYHWLADGNLSDEGKVNVQSLLTDWKDK